MVGGACKIKKKTIQPASRSLWLEVLNPVRKHKRTRKVVEDMTSASPRAILWSITPVHGGAMSKT
jgi:hypothetical protein